MNITFLIGNGFDRNCGLKTSYNDVYAEYCKTPSSSDIIKKFKEDINIDIDNWGYFEVAMCNYLPNFNNEEDFLICLRDFKYFLNQYLTQIDEQFKRRIKGNTSYLYREFVDSLGGFYKGITHNLTQKLSSISPVHNNNINVILFNYTSAFELIYSESRNPNGPNLRININHIHGVLGDDLVLGMDDVSQITNLNYTFSKKSKRAFIKPYFNELYDNNRVTNAKYSINNSDVICVYGMSMGISDLSWRNLLINWMEKNKNAELVFFKHSMSKISVWNAEERMDFEENEKEKLLDAWEVPNEKRELIFEKIHIPCGKNIFNINEAVTKAEGENEETISEIKSRLAHKG